MLSSEVSDELEHILLHECPDLSEALFNILNRTPTSSDTAKLVQSKLTKQLLFPAFITDLEKTHPEIAHSFRILSKFSDYRPHLLFNRLDRGDSLVVKLVEKSTYFDIKLFEKIFSFCKSSPEKLEEILVNCFQQNWKHTQFMLYDFMLENEIELTEKVLKEIINRKNDLQKELYLPLLIKGSNLSSEQLEGLIDDDKENDHPEDMIVDKIERPSRIIGPDDSEQTFSTIN